MVKLDDMLAQATKAYKNAYAPYSHFRVGVCLLADNGRLYSGANVENAAYPSTLCAEMSAIGALITDGARKIKEIVILVPEKQLCPPCGACRQRLSELSSPDTLVHLYNVQGLHRTYTIEELLPAPFGPENLETP